MASSRRRSAGRSPLVRTQSQITSFFSPGKTTPMQSPKLCPTPPSDDSPPSQTKQKKPRLVIPPPPASSANTPPSASKNGCSEDVVGKRIKVFWPLDKTWYEGRVSSFDAVLGKHLVCYDDGEEEVLDLGSEEFEWVEDVPPRSLRRLRRLSDTMKTACSEGSVEKGIAEEDSTDDEEWDKVGGEGAEDGDSEEVDLEDEDDEEIVVRSSSRSKSSARSRKRKKMDVEKMDCAKKIKFDSKKEKAVNKAFSSVTETTAVPVLTNDKGKDVTNSF